MQRTQWTDAQKAEALRIFREGGAAEASKQTGIPIATISSWARRAGVRVTESDRPAQLEARRLTIAERKGALVVGMLDDIERLRTQLFAPTVEKKAMVVDKELVIAEVKLPQPTYADQNRIVASLTTLLDKVLLLSGDATARIEQTGQQAADRAKAEATVLQLAQRVA